MQDSVSQPIKRESDTPDASEHSKIKEDLLMAQELIKSALEQLEKEMGK